MVRRNLIVSIVTGSLLAAGCSGAAAVPQTPAPQTTAGVNAGLPVTVTETSTPTPTPQLVLPDGEVLPTVITAPTSTPTQPSVPTAALPAAPGQDSATPVGWYAYEATVYLDPANVNPSTIACHLHVVNFDGTNDADLTPDSGDCIAAPAISPDGKWIAVLSGYSRNLGAGMASAIKVVSIDGSQTRTFNPQLLSTGGLRWSKDGAQLAHFFQGDAQWHVLDSATGAEITTQPGLDPAAWFFPDVSPDGKYRAGRCEPDVNGLRLPLCITEMAVDTRPLGLWPNAGAAWSPDGAWVAYVVSDGLSSGDTSGDGIWLRHPDGSGQVRIAAGYAGAIWFGAR